jgi:hypothetical protein
MSNSDLNSGYASACQPRMRKDDASLAEIAAILPGPGVIAINGTRRTADAAEDVNKLDLATGQAGRPKSCEDSPDAISDGEIADRLVQSR